MKAVYLVALLLLIFGGCSADRWEGWVYPDRDNLFNSVQLGAFASLEACRASAQQTLAASGWTESGDYECGRNCEYSSEYDTNVCEATER